MRIGIGYDVHELTNDRPLIIGGVTIPHEKGLMGHSDADVLAHAITDALLGSLALGNIGDWFPDTDPAYKDADSMTLLKNVMDDISNRGYQIVNIDSVLIAQEPKFKPFISQICTSISNTLGCKIDQVSVKATTTERLGFEGRQEGIAAQAVVLIKST